MQLITSFRYLGQNEFLLLLITLLLILAQMKMLLKVLPILHSFLFNF